MPAFFMSEKPDCNALRPLCREVGEALNAHFNLRRMIGITQLGLAEDDLIG
jgi:hypothetical protein